MGLLSFLSDLISGPKQQQPVNPHTWAYDQSGYLTPQYGSPAQQPDPSTQVPTAPAPSPTDSKPIDVTAIAPDNWKPKKDTFLGALADAYLQQHGLDPAFQKERDEQNLESAMVGMQSNPMRAVRRIAQFNGPLALKTYNDVVDNQRLQGNLDRQNAIYDMMKQQKVYDHVASMMASAKDPATWQAVRDQATNYGNLMGVDVSSIVPTDFNPDAIETIRAGAVPVAKQEAMSEQTRNHNLQHGDRQANTAEMARHHQVEESQGGQRIGVSQENAATGEYNAQTSRMRANTAAANTTVTTVHSPGKPGYGETVKGNPGQMIWYMPDGTKHLYIRGKDGNHWHYSHQMIDQSEAAKGVGFSSETPPVSTPDD